MTRFGYITGWPEAYLSLALRLKAQGKLVDAAYWAATAAQATGSAAFFEANALAAALAGRLGNVREALEYWDKIVRSAPHKLQWLEAALKYALGKKEAQKYLQAWHKMLLNVFIATPSAQTLALLTANGIACPGGIGIHAGRLKGWLWLEKGQKTSLAVEGVTNFQVTLRPKAYNNTHILYEIDEELPDKCSVVTVRKANGEPVPGCPVICYPPALKKGGQANEITIIIPAYDDYKATLSCIASVLASQKRNKAKSRILVAWDKGPNEKLLVKLRKLAAGEKIKLIENKSNLGFLANVNNAIANVPGGDIILLNADTLVHGDWIDRLAGAAANADAATVTALGNEAELMSYPSASDRGKVAGLKQAAMLDNAAASLPAGDAVAEIPVGVGFCMLITRHALNRIGALDGRNLFRGYGEEVDYCLRAKKAGLKNYGAFNVFVAHLGERSFGAGKKALAAQNNVAIFERFPDYRTEYEQALFHSKPKKLRERIALATLANIDPPPVLELRPWSGRYLPPWAKDERCKPREHGAALFLEHGPRPRALLRVWAEIPVMEMNFDLPEELTLLRKAIKSMRPQKILACNLPQSLQKLAKGITGNYSTNDRANSDLPVWQGTHARLLAAPPRKLAEFKAMRQLAKVHPDKIFYVFHIDSLWMGAPKSDNILEAPRIMDYSLLAPEAFLMPGDFADAPAWRYWLDCHNCEALAIYKGWKSD